MKSVILSVLFSVLAFFAVAEDASTFVIPGVEDPSAFLYQNVDMGAYNLTSCSSAPACGTVMSSYNGISAKSNGKNQCTGSACGGYTSTGYAYQCVELAQRYMHEKHGIAPIWHANANMMCSTHPAGISKTSSPQPGDLWVRTSGTYGHVAVITAVHDSTVDVIEQNSSPSGKNTYKKSDAGCFLTAGHNKSGPCPNKGYYCGNNGLSKNANYLYYCSEAGGNPTLHTSCSFTCEIMPHGQDDKCQNKGSCSKVNTGNYCGSDKIGGDAHTLYRCEGSKPAGSKYCSNGCHTASSGSNDYCN